MYLFFFFFCFVFFFKQKTAYEIYQCDWSSDVCSSDLDSAALYISTKQVKTKNLSRINQYGLNNIYEFIIRNNGADNITNVSWSFNTGESIINSSIDFNLGDNEKIFVIINNSYSTAGSYNVTAIANHENSSDSQTISVNVVPATIATYTLLSLTRTEAVFEFKESDVWNSSLTNVSWRLDTGESNITSDNFNLSPGENVFVFVYHNYSSTGNYSTKVAAKYQAYEDEKELILEVK